MTYCHKLLTNTRCRPNFETASYTVDLVYQLLPPVGQNLKFVGLQPQLKLIFCEECFQFADCCDFKVTCDQSVLTGLLAPRPPARPPGHLLMRVLFVGRHRVMSGVAVFAWHAPVL